jgi:hypothetical protein
LQAQQPKAPPNKAKTRISQAASNTPKSKASLYISLLSCFVEYLIYSIKCSILREAFDLIVLIAA